MPVCNIDASIIIGAKYVLLMPVCIIDAKY